MKFCKITRVHEYILKFILNFLQLIEAKDFSQFCFDYIGKDDKINHFTMQCFKVKVHGHTNLFKGFIVSFGL